MKSGASESSYVFLEEYYKFPENIIVSHLPQELQQSNKPIKVLWSHHSYDQPVYLNFDFSICDLIVCPSNWLKQQFIHYHKIPENKLIVIPNGVSKQFTYSSRKSKTFIYTSVPYKGLEVLAQIIPHIPEATFKIFSGMNLYDIQDDSYIELYEYLKSLPNVIYSPAVDQAELIEHLQDAAFFIHPNIWEETFCVSLAEAMSCGCFPILTDIGALPEVSNEIANIVPMEGTRTSKGYEVTDNFIQSFISTCKSALYFFENEREYYDQYSLQASQYATEHYDWKRIAGQWRQALQQESPKYYCMVSTRKSQQYTEYALKSFFKNTTLNSQDQFFLIDNDKSLDISTLDFRVNVIFNASPRSFSQNVNLILKLALADSADYVFLNNDIIFTPNWTNELFQRNCISLPLCNQFVCGQTDRFTLNPAMDLNDYIGYEDDLNLLSKQITSSYQLQETPSHISFYCFFLPYEVSSTVGLFDEEFGQAGGEDIDYRLRARNAGIETQLVTGSYLLHFAGKSTWRGGETQQETQIRNQTYIQHFTEKWGQDLASTLLFTK
jgi:glycosyltransferase involved in cell wall biosynthesis/GT2 family glycosyltransferase